MASNLLYFLQAEDCEAMRTALAAANAHNLLLTAQQQEKASCSLQDPPETLGGSTACTAGSVSTHTAGLGAAAQSPGASAAAAATPRRNSLAGASHACSAAAVGQEGVMHELQQQLAVRQQQLDLASEQIKELVEHLALKHDAVQIAEQRAAMLQHQVCVSSGAVPAGESTSSYKKTACKTQCVGHSTQSWNPPVVPLHGKWQSLSYRLGNYLQAALSA
jgi:hypothetical protein